MQNRDRMRIVIIEDGADLTPDVIVREPVPMPTLPLSPFEEPNFRDLRIVEAEYIGPRRAA